MNNLKFGHLQNVYFILCLCLHQIYKRWYLSISNWQKGKNTFSKHEMHKNITKMAGKVSMAKYL